MPMLWTDEMNPMKMQGSEPLPKKFDALGQEVTDEDMLEAGQEQVQKGEALGPKDPPDDEDDEDEGEDGEEEIKPRTPSRPTPRRFGR